MCFTCVLPHSCICELHPYKVSDLCLLHRLFQLEQCHRRHSSALNPKRCTTSDVGREWPHLVCTYYLGDKAWGSRVLGSAKWD